jgi:hypothetical protein
MTMFSIRIVPIAAHRAIRHIGRGVARIVPTAVIAIGALATIGRPAEAQTTSERSGWEFIVPSGTVIPTGTQRDAIKRANLSAAQLSYVIHPSVALIATIGWARSRDIATADEPKLDLFTYDLGAEVRAPRWNVRDALTFMPFAGVGAGARSYNYRSLHVDATHNLAAYGGVGGELGYGRVGVRLEARNYVTGFRPLVGPGGSETRNDVALMIGLRIDW